MDFAAVAADVLLADDLSVGVVDEQEPLSVGDDAASFDAEVGGYRARVEIPEDFFELEFSKPAYWNALVLLSGEGGRGLGTVSKVYANDPGTSAATMVDDVPTESRLQPGGWTKINLNGKGESK